MLSAFDVAEKFLKNQSKPQGLAVFQQWSEIVGESYAKITAPYKIITMARRNVLIIQAKLGYGIIIQHESWNILQLINKYLGHKYFSQIKVIQSSNKSGGALSCIL